LRKLIEEKDLKEGVFRIEDMTWLKKRVEAFAMSRILDIWLDLAEEVG
jgi:hypothetical protein